MHGAFIQLLTYKQTWPKLKLVVGRSGKLKAPARHPRSPRPFHFQLPTAIVLPPTFLYMSFLFLTY